MKILNYELFERQAELCGTMANPRRLAIMEILCKGEVGVGEIAEALEISISAASQHLRVMRDRGLVVSRKEGQAVYYLVRNETIIDACHAIRRLLLTQLQASGQLAKDFDPEQMIER